MQKYGTTWASWILRRQRYGLIIREGLSDTLDDKALVDKHVQPLTEGVGVTQHMEF